MLRVGCFRSCPLRDMPVSLRIVQSGDAAPDGVSLPS